MPMSPESFSASVSEMTVFFSANSSSATLHCEEGELTVSERAKSIQRDVTDGLYGHLGEGAVLVEPLESRQVSACR